MERRARIQAAAAVAGAVALWCAWALWGTPVKVRWLVARGAPPAAPEAGESAAAGIRAVGVPARPVLLSVLQDGSSSRARKSWVAALLLRTPFFAEEEVEKALASPHRPTARAAAFALLHGEEDPGTFEEGASRAERPEVGAVPLRRASAETWDPAPAVPVLVEWLGDREDREARFAARLLGRVPPGDPRAKAALLAVLEEVRTVGAPDASPAVQARKFLLIDVLQSLLHWAAKDREVVEKVAAMVAWIEERGLHERDWDLQTYSLRLFEVARGRGVDPRLFEGLATHPNTIVRMTLAGTLEAVPGDGSAGVLGRLLADEVYTVRNSALRALRKRKDPMLPAEAGYLVEDSYPFLRAETVIALGELTGTAPEACRAALPLIVSCLEDPWPGPAPPAGHAQARLVESARPYVIEQCAIAINRITGSCPGFSGDDLTDWRKRTARAKALADDAAARRKVVEELRRTIPARPEAERIPCLVRRLEDRDPDNVLRAVRELSRIVPDGPPFPPPLLLQGPDDTAPRNLVRELRKTGAWKGIVEAWSRGR